MSHSIPQILADELATLKERLIIIEHELAGMHDRNRRVELNKTWEMGAQPDSFP